VTALQARTLQPSPAMVLQPSLAMALLAALCLPAAVIAAEGGSSAPVPQSALHACAIIAAATERLACYDQLSGRTAPSGNAPLAATPPSVAPALGSAAAATAPSVTSAAAATGTPSAIAAPESFGLYSAEHPAPPPASRSFTARVEALGGSASGHMTVALEGGALWELDEGDPLLAVGDTVNIRRAALGSFIMETPSKRIHRVHRLR
jgi:hypothetical protein